MANLSNARKYDSHGQLTDGRHGTALQNQEEDMWVHNHEQSMFSSFLACQGSEDLCPGGSCKKGRAWWGEESLHATQWYPRCNSVEALALPHWEMCESFLKKKKKKFYILLIKLYIEH